VITTRRYTDPRLTLANTSEVAVKGETSCIRWKQLLSGLIEPLRGLMFAVTYGNAHWMSLLYTLGVDVKALYGLLYERGACTDLNLAGSLTFHSLLYM